MLKGVLVRVLKRCKRGGVRYYCIRGGHNNLPAYPYKLSPACAMKIIAVRGTESSI